MCQPVGPGLRRGRRPRRGAPPPPYLLLPGRGINTIPPAPSLAVSLRPKRLLSILLAGGYAMVPANAQSPGQSCWAEVTAQDRRLLLGPWGLPLLLDPSSSRPDHPALHRSLLTPGLSFPQDVSKFLFCLCPARHPVGLSSSAPRRAGRGEAAALGFWSGAWQGGRQPSAGSEPPLGAA